MVTKQETCGQAGEITFTCTDPGCGATKVEEISPSGDHSMTAWATGKTDGVEQHWPKCSVCGEQDTTNKSNCYGGIATSSQKAQCVVCGQGYGTIAVSEVDISKYVIIRPSQYYTGDGDSQQIVNDASSHLRDKIHEATGVRYSDSITMIIYDDNSYQYYSSKPNFIIIDYVNDRPDNGLTNNISADLVAQAQQLGDQAYIIQQDSAGNVYICGATPSATYYGVNAFLKLMFGYEQYGVDNYNITQVSTDGSYKLQVNKINGRIAYCPTIQYRSTGYAQILSTENKQDGYGMNYSAQYGVEQMMFIAQTSDGKGDWSINKSHNALSWLPYDSTHSNWYNGQSGSDLDLCYTAHGNSSDYQAMVTAVKNKVKEIVALPCNAKLDMLMLGKQDETPICVCSACESAKSTYGSYAGAVVKFFNDVMTAIEADSTITRKDFKLMFLAYTDFETAPTGITLHSRIVPMLAFAYAFNYQADIYHSTNDAGRANLQAWAGIANELYLWTYSAKFNNYMYPVDTFAFYNENAYRFFAQNKVSMLVTQGSYDQTGTQTAWGNLKMYLESQLSWDATQTQAELIAKYMTQTFGPAATAMTNFFNSVRTACQRDVLVNAYAGCDHPYTILANELQLNEPNYKIGSYKSGSKYWEQATVQSWLDYCSEAYSAIASLESTSPTLYARYKKAIDAEWLSPACMMLELWGSSGDVTKANFNTVYTSLGITQCRETYPNTIYLISEYVTENFK